MGRRKHVLRTIQKCVAIREDHWIRIETECYSELEGRIPYGKQRELFDKIFSEYFGRLDAARKKHAKTAAAAALLPALPDPDAGEVADGA